jgi:hypothetical protein
LDIDVAADIGVYGPDIDWDIAMMWTLLSLVWLRLTMTTTQKHLQRHLL